MVDESPETDRETPAEKVIAKTPWWAMSTAIHVVMILVMAYLIVLGSPPSDADATVVTTRRTPRTLPDMQAPQLPDAKNRLDVKKPSEEPVFDKEKAEQTETFDDEFTDKAKGDPDFVSMQPFRGVGTNGVIGTAGGGGGRFGQRGPGGRATRVKDGGGGKNTEDAVKAALKWLARHQNDDGSWSVIGYTARCRAAKCAPAPGHEDFDPGVTGLALLAFLGAGYSHLSRDVEDGICFGDVVKKGLQWIIQHQDPEGCIGPRTTHQYMYNHLIAALALCEAFGLTGSILFKDRAQLAVDFTVAAQNPGRAWRYSYKSGDNDSSVSGWGVMVLKSAEYAGLGFPRSAYAGAIAWFDEATDENYYRVGYTHKGTGKVHDAHNERFNHHEALTAVGMMARAFIDRDRNDARLRGGVHVLSQDLPVWKDVDIDFYYWYYAALALFQVDGATGATWRSWNDKMKDVLVKNQNTATAGCKSGSWEPVDRWSCEGGRVYATAINALTLEVYYRYANVFVGK